MENFVKTLEGYININTITYVLQSDNQLEVYLISKEHIFFTDTRDIQSIIKALDKRIVR